MADLCSYQSKKVKNKEFDEILLQVIEQSFAQIGRSMGKVVYHYLERDFSVSRKRIPMNTRTFSACLKAIFGEGTQVLIEMLIVEKLYAEIDTRLQTREDYNFSDYVKKARKIYITKK